jgi:cytochrome b involved in lipid metabolism
MKTTIALLVLFFTVLGGGYVVYSHAHQAAPLAANGTPAQAASSATDAKGSDSIADTYTSAEVATHDTASSCWTSINGNVYDLTAWVRQHPGGEADILSICGKDGTQAFEQQHGRPRDTQPQQILATFKIGTLAS